MHASQLLELLLMSLAGRGPRNTYWNRPQSSGPRGGARTAAESDSFWSLCREFEQMAPLPTLFTHFPRCYSARLGSLGVFFFLLLYSRHRPRRIDHRDERALALSAASSDSSPCPVQVMCGRFHTESHLNHKSQGVYTKRKKKTLEKKHQSISFFLFTFPLFSSLWGPKNFTTRQLNSWSLALCLCLYIYRIYIHKYTRESTLWMGERTTRVLCCFSVSPIGKITLGAFLEIKHRRETCNRIYTIGNAARQIALASFSEFFDIVTYISTDATLGGPFLIRQKKTGAGLDCRKQFPV